jgi:hypothetical protein
MANHPPDDARSDYKADERGPGLSDLVTEAQERFERCLKWEQTARQHFLDDYKFANADAYNGYQWPNDLRRTREVDDRPSLTLNGVRQHNLQITNDAKQNKPGIKVMPTGNEATFESAQVLSAMMRHIEYDSNAITAYDTATHFQVNAGWGYLRVVTEYDDDDTFDQSIKIKRVIDPLTIYLDPDAKEADKSDAKFAFVFEDIEREEFEKSPRWKDYQDIATSAPLGGDSGWHSEDYFRVAEYYRVVEKEDVLYALPKDFIKGFPGGFIRKSLLEAGGKKNLQFRLIVKAIEGNKRVRKRDVITQTVEYKLIIGEHEIESEAREWPGKYIPIIPVLGEETIIEGTMDRKSHTRSMLDAQRMYNYAASSAVEFMGLQTKTPWLVAVESIEELETYWNEANRVNTSALPYKALREDGSQLPSPTRIQPPTAAPIYATQMQASLQDLLMTSGQYAAQMGGQGNERSAKAIGERQRQSDNATYHFIDNLGVAIRHLGRVILDLIPKIYDTKRVIQMLAEDGQSMEVVLDPQAAKHYQQVMTEDNKVAQHILNPSVGKYEVQADIGPNYATRREEAFDAFKLILTQNPQLSAVLGDILFRAGDFPHAEEAAQRLRRLVPAQALGEGPSQKEQAQQQMIQNLQNLLSNAMTELAAEKLKLRGKEAKSETDIYNALTARLKVLVDAAAKGEAEITPETLAPVLGDLLDQSGQASLEPATVNVDEALKMGTPASAGLPLSATQMRPPVAGAKQDVNGNWFARDFTGSKEYRRL